MYLRSWDDAVVGEIIGDDMVFIFNCFGHHRLSELTNISNSIPIVGCGINAGLLLVVRLH